VWDHEQVMGVVRGFVAEHLRDQPLVVAALDESGQEKTGEDTVGVKRQYMGCAGRIANGVNNHLALMTLLGAQAQREVVRARHRVMAAMRAQTRLQGVFLVVVRRMGIGWLMVGLIRMSCMRGGVGVCMCWSRIRMPRGGCGGCLSSGLAVGRWRRWCGS
jgi:hypothetical protein